MGFAGSDASLSELNGAEWLQVFALGITAFANAWNAAFIFSLVGFMAVEFDMSETVDTSGYYAGFIGSAIMVGAVVNSFFVGWVSDNWGRKPVLICGCLGVGFNTLFLGFVHSFWAAVTLRFLGGLMNGIVPIIKILCAELLDGRYPSMLMTMIMGMWSVCVAFAPSVSGILTPVSKLKAYNSTIPVVSADGMLQPNPFFYSCMLTSFIGFFSCYLCYKYLPETLKDEEPASVAQDEEQYVSKPVAPADSATDLPKRLWDGDIPITIAIYTFWAFLQLFMDEVAPIWAIASVDLGGLGYTPTEAGEMLGVTGFMMLFANFVLYPFVSRYFTLVQLFPIATFTTAAAAFFEASVSNAVSKLGSEMLTFLAVCFLNGMRACGLTVGFTCVAQLCNNACPQKLRGRAAGLGFLTSSLVRSFAPTIGTVLFAWSINSDVSNVSAGLTHPPQDHGMKLPVPTQGPLPATTSSWVNYNFTFWSFSAAAILETILGIKYMKARLNYPVDMKRDVAQGEVELEALIGEEESA